MPRVLPKKPRFADSDICRAWQSFSTDLPDGTALTIPRGTRLRGNHAAVRACGWNFVLDSEPDDVEPNPYDVSVPEPMFTEPQRLRLKTAVTQGTRPYPAGTVLEFDAKTAEWLITDNHAELA